LTRQIDFTGKSGAVYRYTILEDERFLPPVGANFIVAEVEGQGARVLFVGETESLSARAWEPMVESARRPGVRVEVLTRLNVRSAIRREECEDLVQSYAPPLNAG